MYKVGEIITTEYKNAPVPPSRQYDIGQRIYITDDQTKKKLATFVVLETNEREVKGKVITTYGHKRRSTPQ